RSPGDPNFSGSASTMPRAAGPLGAFGGNQADFQPLIDLITATVAPTTWDTTGGPGSIMEFPSGVYVDAQGVLRPAMKLDRGGGLAQLRRAAREQSNNRDSRQASPLRKVSLVRLERQVELLAAQGLRPT